MTTHPARPSPRRLKPLPLMIAALCTLCSGVGAAAPSTTGPPAAATAPQTITLKASHQFPADRSDARTRMVQLIAQHVAAANVGLEIKVFPGATLVKPQAQWKAMLSGQIDMTALPLDYASGSHPQFGATLMPGLVKSHEHALRLNRSPFMDDIRAIIDQGGVRVLADAWLAGAFAGKDKCIVAPSDAAGLKVRSAGATFSQMWIGAGATVSPIPSSEVYDALKTDLIGATDTSTGSFVSFQLYDRVKCVTAPGDHALWFMYEPVLISKRAFERLNEPQKKALLEASRKAQDYFAVESRKLDERMVKTFALKKVEVVRMTGAQAEAWREVAKATSYRKFAEEVPGGKALIEKALSVE